MPSPFDYANNICSSKENIWTDDSEKEYVPFMVNRALSYHVDTVFFAQEMNQRSHASKKMQYDFLRHAIEVKKKRFAKWSKAVEDTTLQLVKEAYQVNDEVALSFLELLSNEQIELIKSTMDKGGTR